MYICSYSALLLVSAASKNEILAMQISKHNEDFAVSTLKIAIEFICDKAKCSISRLPINRFHCHITKPLPQLNSKFILKRCTF